MQLLDLPTDIIKSLLLSTNQKPIPLTNVDFYTNKLWQMNGQQSYDKCNLIVVQIASHTSAVIEDRMVDIVGHGAYPIKDIKNIGHIRTTSNCVAFVVGLKNDGHLTVAKSYKEGLVGETNKQLLTYIRQDLIYAINSVQCTCSNVSLFY